MNFFRIFVIELNIIIKYIRLFLFMRKKQNYLSFFYGCKQDLTKAFTTITNGDYVRYIVTAETLICRFKSNKSIDDITDILKEHCPNVPFFIFPISNSKWKYNLPLDVEHNLLTDNPIINVPQNDIINNLFSTIINEMKKYKSEITDEENIDNLNNHLKKAIQEEDFELAARIRDRIKEILNQEK